MTRGKSVLFIAILGIGTIVIGYGLYNHVIFSSRAHHLKDHMAIALRRAFSVKVKAAKLENIVAPAPYFPPGSVWTQDISHAPLDPQSSAMIAWLADAGGWGHNNRMQVDFAIRVLQANSATPNVPFRKGAGLDAVTIPTMSTAIPLPPGGGIEGAAGLSVPEQRRRLPSHRGRPRPRQTLRSLPGQLRG